MTTRIEACGQNEMEAAGATRTRLLTTEDNEVLVFAVSADEMDDEDIRFALARSKLGPKIRSLNAQGCVFRPVAWTFHQLREKAGRYGIDAELRSSDPIVKAGEVQALLQQVALANLSETVVLEEGQHLCALPIYNVFGSPYEHMVIIAQLQ